MTMMIDDTSFVGLLPDADTDASLSYLSYPCTSKTFFYGLDDAFYY